jgi:uncharacterized protein (TIGR02145 family)
LNKYQICFNIVLYFWCSGNFWDKRNLKCFNIKSYLNEFVEKSFTKPFQMKKRLKHLQGVYLSKFLLLTFSFCGIVLKAQVTNSKSTSNNTILENRILKLEEIKVRWKKVALESCSPCPTTVPLCSGCVLSSTGKIWMDRNLGATRVATSPTDHLSYGDLYQWGRGSDGHQLVTWSNGTTGIPVNGITSTLSSTDSPGNSNFITNSVSPSDWRAPKNDNLWQGVGGTNNPCPSGFRLPTAAEWEAERAIFPTNNALGAYNSVLKLPSPGLRFFNTGNISLVGTDGFYWSSNVGNTNVNLSQDLQITLSPGFNAIADGSRGSGFSVRCIKN